MFLLVSMSAEPCPVFSAPKTLVSAVSSEQLGRGGRELNLRASPMRLLKVCSLPRLAWAQEHPGCSGEWGARRDPWLQGAHPSLGSEQGQCWPVVPGRPPQGHWPESVGTQCSSGMASSRHKMLFSIMKRVSESLYFYLFISIISLL